jgi:hypothetical protein
VGNSIVHDFTLGEGDDDVLYSWAGIWSSKTVGKNGDSMSTTATPARRKKGTITDTPKIKRESMLPGGDAKDYEIGDDEGAAIPSRYTPGEWFDFLNGQFQPAAVGEELSGEDLSKEGEQDQN